MTSKKIESIQLFRGIAVLMVIAFHFRQYLNGVYAQNDLGDRLFGLGEMGVDIFFVISGFIIVYSSKNALANTAFEFSIKRFFRLYPVYIITFAFLLVADYSTNHSNSDIIKSSFLIPNDYNFIGPWYGYSINLPAWTLTYEVLFYAVFAISISISHKYRSIISMFLLVSLCCLSQLYFRGFLQIDPITRDTVSYSAINNLVFTSNPIVYDFIFGVILGEAYIRYSERISAIAGMKPFLIITLMISAMIMFSGFNRGAGIERWGLMSFVLVGSLLFYERVSQLKCNSVLVYVGELSYSLYINHMIVKKLSGIYLKGAGIYHANGGITLFVILFGLTFVMSIITYHLIEKPSVRLGHAIAKTIMKRNASPSLSA